MKTVTLKPNSIYSGNLILVNANDPYHRPLENLALIPVNDKNCNILQDYHVVRLLSIVMKEISGWGHIAAVSGWRSAEEQQEIYTLSLAQKGIDFTGEHSLHCFGQQHGRICYHRVEGTQ